MPVLADDLAIAALVVGIGGLLLTAYDVCKDNPDAQFTKKLAMTYTVWQKDWVDRFKHMTNVAAPSSLKELYAVAKDLAQRLTRKRGYDDDIGRSLWDFQRRSDVKNSYGPYRAMDSLDKWMRSEEMRNKIPAPIPVAAGGEFCSGVRNTGSAQLACSCGSRWDWFHVYWQSAAGESRRFDLGKLVAYHKPRMTDLFCPVCDHNMGRRREALSGHLQGHSKAELRGLLIGN